MSIEKKEVRNSKVRLSVPFSPMLYREIEKESEALGVSMSSMVAFIVGQYLASKNTMMNSAKQILESQISQLQDLKSIEDKFK